MYFAMLTNWPKLLHRIHILDKYICLIWTDAAFSILDKYVLEFGQIYLDKYILQFGQINFGQQPETKDNEQNQILDPKSQKHNPETQFPFIFKTKYKGIASIPLNLEIVCSFYYTMSRSKDRQNWRVLIFKIEQEHPGDVIIW